MIKIKPYSDTDWYINKIKRIIVNGNVKKENFDKYYNDKIKEYNDELTKFGVSLSDFPNRKSKNLFEEFLVADFDDLNKIKQKIDCNKYNNFTKLLSKLYDKFSVNNINNDIVEKTKIKACPYCNENFVINRGTTKTTAQLDHYFPRSLYPIFSICLYNLVPSCPSCNQIKGPKSIGVSPYNQNYDCNSLKFSYLPLSHKFIDDYNELEIKFIYEENQDGENIKTNIENLQIDKSYKYHTDYVQELVKKRIIYNDSLINELLNYSDLFSSKEELIRIVFGNYICENDFYRRPLSKLTKDILEEIGIVL